MILFFIDIFVLIFSFFLYSFLIIIPWHLNFSHQIKTIYYVHDQRARYFNFDRENLKPFLDYWKPIPEPYYSFLSQLRKEKNYNLMIAMMFEFITNNVSLELPLCGCGASMEFIPRNKPKKVFTPSDFNCKHCIIFFFTLQINLTYLSFLSVNFSFCPICWQDNPNKERNGNERTIILYEKKKEVVPRDTYYECKCGQFQHDEHNFPMLFCPCLTR